MGDDCAAASQSQDARDKYFPVSASGFNLAGGEALQAELPALAAAMASLSSAMADIAALPPCDGGAALRSALAELASSSLLRSAAGRTDEFDDADVKRLLATARS